ncbi:hypothetical protein RND81_07G189200 [Saponaria officinalis]|uniref:SAM domain-containing protein n=1 Tax=Saponaria officinalis TaxID=3572 RepID=A0AAW1JS61_SAPOF
MSDGLRSSRVTVTLGRSGRVVKRTVGLSDEVQNGVPILGNKRPIKDRLGGSSDGRGESHNKRQRGESTSNSIDLCLGKDDLRFKLMEKTTGRESRKSESLRNIDLREKLSSKTSRPSADSMRMRPPESAASTRHPVLDPRVTGMTRHPVLESRDTRIIGRLPPSRHPSELSAVAPRSYPSWALENSRQGSPEVLRRISPEVLRLRSTKEMGRRSPDVSRQRSPVKLLRPSAVGGISPQRSREELQIRPLMRSYDDGRSTSYVRISPTRAVRSSPYLIQSFVPAAVNSVVPVSHHPQASGIMQKNPSLVDTHPTVDSLLQSLDLDKYAIYFKAEEVDMNALKQLGDSDLKDLGIPMGPRKKILQAVMPRARRQL